MAHLRRRDIVRQHDGMECGVAALAMICRALGLKVPLRYLGGLCVPTTGGVSMKGIADAANDLGIKSLAGKITLEELRSAPVPCILHWNQEHFVVLRSVGKKKWHIADPARGAVRLSDDEFAAKWLSTTRKADGKPCGVAMFFEPGPDFGKNVPEPSPGSERSFAFLMGYLRHHRRKVAYVVAGMLIGCLLELAMPFLTQATVDVGIARRDIGLVWLILLGELMIVAGRAAADFVRRRLLLHISMHINISLVSDFFAKLLRLPMNFFETKLLGDILRRMADHSRVQNFLTGQLLGIVFSIITFVVFSVVLCRYNLLIFAVFMIGSAAYALWIARFLHRRKVLDYDLFACEARNQNQTYQFVTAMQEIKLQGCRERRRREWEEVQAELFEINMRSLRLQQTQEAGSIFINELKNILITVLAATAVIQGSMTLGGMLAVQFIIGQLNSPVQQFMGFIHSLQDVKISLERINEIHTTPDEPRGECPAAVGAADICFKNVDFKYDRHAIDLTVSDINFTAPAGKVTAIVGASGSGKTTLVKLMLGYYPPLEGCITVGSRPLAELDPDWWREQCGAVMQEGVIFSESIRRNIAVGDGEVDEERMRHAAELANIAPYINSLPLGYDTKIGRDGAGLSQGQKQRVLIARAIYKNPPFIFLDEATNALDAENERLIVENLAEFYRGRTVLVVAHRLSTVRNADRIIVLDRGRIAEIGTHATLVAARGKYFRLISNQLELGS